MITVSKDYEKTLYFNDVHAPYEDKIAWECMLEFIRWWKPETIINLGDFIDFYQFSKFDKRPDRLNELQSDIDDAVNLLAQLRDAAPNARMIYKGGNHDGDRLQRYLWAHAELSNLRAMALESMLELDRFNIEYYPPHKDYLHYGFLCEHGNLVSKHSAMSAKSEVERSGVSGISGHTHRLGSFYRKNYGSEVVWFENGCMCDLNPEYCKHPNWQQGFTIGYHKNSGRFEMHQVPILSGKATYASIEFTAGE